MRCGRGVELCCVVTAREEMVNKSLTSMQRYRKRQQNIQLSRRRGRHKEGAGRRGGTKPQAAFCMAPESPPVKWLGSEG